jgi:hypothetical protein
MAVLSDEELKARLGSGSTNSPEASATVMRFAE